MRKALNITVFDSRHLASDSQCKKLDLGIAFSPIRIGWRLTDEYWGKSIIDSEEISEIENIVEDYKTKKKNDIIISEDGKIKKYIVGNRISISFTFGEDFWVLGTYEKQVNRIKSYLSEIDTILNEMN